MEVQDVFARLGIALGLGLLVGLQRQRGPDDIAGFRTFPLVTLSGALCALLAEQLEGGWVLAAGFVALAALVVVGNVAKISLGHPEPGLTTEVAVLLLFAVGAVVTIGQPLVGVAVAGAAAVLLQWKRELHGLAARIGDDDFRAITQFVLVTMVILPVLPDRGFGPYEVLNPRQIWWMVVLIVGLSLLGYVAYKLLGRRAGTVLAGVLGGLVSSVATTVSFARRARSEQVSAVLAARVMLIATAVVYLRVLVEIGIVHPPLLRIALPPLLTMAVVLALLTLLGWRRGHGGPRQELMHGNPSELRSALLFAAIYAAVLLAVAWAKEELGRGGLFVVAGLSGLVDMNAITLSTAQLVHGGQLEGDLAWRAVLLASLANLVFKGGIVAVWGGARLSRRMLVLWGVALLVGTALLLFWPGSGSLLG